MTVMIQVRNVPEALHRRLKSRAAARGMSLSEHLLAELKRIAETPTRRAAARCRRSWPPSKAPSSRRTSARTHLVS